jgi:selenocysteine lyase/cysteine desulfurase
MSTLPPQRHLFDIPEAIAYFNCAYNSPQLNESRARLRSGVDSKSRPWERTPASFFEDADRVRTLAAGIFGGDADGYAVVPAASYGISAAARAIEPQLRPGDRILLMAEEFPSNVLPWQRTARETGAVVAAVPTPDAGGWTRAILSRIDRSVKVVAVSTCHWTNGARVDLSPLAEACREVGGALVVDATQSLGAMPLRVHEVQPDFLVAAGYKWLLCPYGFGLLYVSERWRDARPLEESWLAREGAENFAALANYSAVYQPGARRFEVGEKCAPTLLPGAIAALEQIAAWGVDRIAESLAVLNERIAAHLEQLGFRLPGRADRCPHVFGAQLPAGHTGNLVAELRARRIFISQRGDAVRFAPHLHVTPEDVDRLIHALEEQVAPA